MNRKIQKNIALLMVVLQIPLWCTGCWDSMEINNRSVILEFAIDKNIEEEEMPERHYAITYTIPDMAKLSGTNSLAENVSTSVVVKSPTIAASIDDLETRTQNTVTFSHVKAMLVGKALLEDEKLFESMMAAISRDMLIARNVPFVAVDGTAQEVAQSTNPQNPVLGLYLLNYFNNKERPISYFKPQLMGNFIRDMEETGIATMPILRLGEDNQIDISGGAVMQDYDLVDFINRDEVKGQLFVQGEIKNAPVVITHNDKYLTYMIKNQKSKVKFEQTAKGLTCHITIEVTGEISDYTSSDEDNIFDTSQIKVIQKLIENKIVEETKLGVDKAQELGVDYIGLGVEMYRKNNKLWQQYQEGWHQTTFKNLPVVIEAKVDIKSTGILE
ncbi:MAG: Ger(x)C family spore germination protein [Cellulosilyticaceae bacterium]